MTAMIIDLRAKKTKGERASGATRAINADQRLTVAAEQHDNADASSRDTFVVDDEFLDPNTAPMMRDRYRGRGSVKRPINSNAAPARPAVQPAKPRSSLPLEMHHVQKRQQAAHLDQAVPMRRSSDPTVNQSSNAQPVMSSPVPTGSKPSHQAIERHKAIIKTPKVQTVKVRETFLLRFGLELFWRFGRIT